MEERSKRELDWIEALPNSWSVRKIKSFLTERKDVCSAGDHYDLLAVSEYYGVARKSDVISADDFETRAESLDGYKICRPNDLVMNIMLAWKRSTGVSCYTGITSPAYCVFHSTESVCMRYFHYLFRTELYADLFKRYSTGIIDSRLRLYPDKFLSLYCHFPDVKQQQLIANYLDNKCSIIDSYIKDANGHIDLYSKLKRSIITKAITKGIHPGVQTKDSGIEWIGDIPSSWRIMKFKHLGKSWNGLTYKPEDLCDAQNGTLVLRSSNIQNGQLLFEDNVYVSSSVPESKMVHENDILICSRNGSAQLIGKNVLIPRNLNASFGAFMMVYRCCSPLFLRYVLNSDIFSYNVASFLTATVNQLTTGNFDNITFCYPTDPNEREEIVKYLDRVCEQIDDIINKKRQFVKELDLYKRSLIFEYVTGKKQLNNDSYER